MGLQQQGTSGQVQEIRESGRVCSVSLTGHRTHQVEFKVQGKLVGLLETTAREAGRRWVLPPPPQKRVSTFWSL